MTSQVFPANSIIAPDGKTQAALKNGASNATGLLLMAVVFGLFASILNQLIYQSSEPFYDSMSYHDKVYRVMMRSAHEGLKDGLDEAINGNSTSFLPMFMAAFVGLMVEPTRLFGVWFQVAELTVFLISVDVYLRKIWQFDGRTRGLIETSFATLACLYFTNGGMSDFRMDLSLALMFGTAMQWCLLARHTLFWRDFFFFGLAMGLMCLIRATSPVYVFVALAPIFIGDLFINRLVRTRRTMGWLFSIVIMGLTSSWFFILKFDFLYHYYFIWNTDANAKLPWLESLNHLKLVGRQFGAGFCVYLLSAAIINIQFRLKEKKGGIEFPFRKLIAPLWMAMAPLGMLIGMRMGLNPFVSLPTALMANLCVSIALVGNFRMMGKPFQRAFLAALILAIGISVTRGWLKHANPREGLMAGHQQVIDAIVSDARHRKLKALHYGTLQMVDYDTSSLESVLRFDRTDTTKEGLAIRIGEVQLMPARTFTLPAVADWRELNGSTDEMKIENLVDVASVELDYLLVPTPETVQVIAQGSFAEVVNQHIKEIWTKLQSNSPTRWQKVAGPFGGKKNRTYELWSRIDANLN